MTDFGKHQPVNPDDASQGTPPPTVAFPRPSQGGPGQPGWTPPPGQQGGYPAPEQQGSYPPPGQQGGYPAPGQQGGYPAPGQQGAYPAAPPPPPGAYGYPVGPGNYPALPPGVEPASVGRRIGAFFLSYLLIIVTLVIGYLIWGAILWSKGTSPALRVLGMRCVDANTGRPVGWGKMALRDIVGYIVQGILSIITLLVSFIMFLATGRHQSLPDTIASTVVVYDPNKVLDS